jgi:hypothetical protein
LELWHTAPDGKDTVGGEPRPRLTTSAKDRWLTRFVLQDEDAGSGSVGLLCFRGTSPSTLPQGAPGLLDTCGALDAGHVDIFLLNACPGWADRGLQLFFCNTSLHWEAGTLTERRVDGVTSCKVGGGDGSLLPDLRFGGVAEED